MSQYFSNIYDVVKTMISGMSLTLEHLRKKKDLVATLQYPNEKWPQPERSIGFEHKDYNKYIGIDNSESLGLDDNKTRAKIF